jgi:tRNA:m4X modification enzyme
VRALLPPEAEPYMRPDASRPFSLKHATQQASLVGNLQGAGLLGAAGGGAAGTTTFVEFGAGKGYLSSMLADCCGGGLGGVVLMDRRGFKGKADRYAARAARAAG